MLKLPLQSAKRRRRRLSEDGLRHDLDGLIVIERAAGGNASSQSQKLPPENPHAPPPQVSLQVRTSSRQLTVRLAHLQGLEFAKQ